MVTRTQLKESIKNTFEQAQALVESKNDDYASEEDALKNFRASTVVGVSIERGILVRVMDKIVRTTNLLEKKNTVEGETINDSILDAINYLAILKSKLEDK